MKPAIRLAFALVSLLAAAAQAEIVIVVGDHLLLPNTPNQTIQIFVSGDVPVGGMNFNAVLGDGGSILGGVDDVVPKMTADILTGTIFAAHAANAVNLNPTFDFGIGLAAWSITTTSGTLIPNGLLATLIIDTTGFSSCELDFAINLDSPNAGPTDFAPIPANITNGAIVNLCPEPTSAALALFAAAGLGAAVLRQRRPPFRITPKA